MKLLNNIILETKLRQSPRKTRPNRRETMYLAECVWCGRSRWLTKHNLKRDQKCKRCAGIDGARTRQDIRSTSEGKVAGWLDVFGLPFDQQYPDYKRSYLFDFRLNTYIVPAIFIEIVGYWHKIAKGEKDKQFIGSGSVLFLNDDVSFGELAWVIGKAVDGVSQYDLLATVMA